MDIKSKAQEIADQYLPNPDQSVNNKELVGKIVELAASDTDPDGDEELQEKLVAAEKEKEETAKTLEATEKDLKETRESLVQAVEKNQGLEAHVNDKTKLLDEANAQISDLTKKVKELEKAAAAKEKAAK